MSSKNRVTHMSNLIFSVFPVLGILCLFLLFVEDNFRGEGGRPPSPLPPPSPPSPPGPHGGILPYVKDTGIREHTCERISEAKVHFVTMPPHVIAIVVLLTHRKHTCRCGHLSTS